ncbi:MAG: hydroxymethylbilane synthase [Verrucomicrobia bacterium]|nr:MAG: hydroxymethylbilane synthase [Verrucomicrobiota bacterium]
MSYPTDRTLTVATRRSPLALAQADLVVDHLRARLPDAEFELSKMVTTGDKQREWSLEKQGGKGLFTGELERALIDGEADLAVHSGKDLPTVLGEGLVLAGFLPREVAHDVLVLPEGREFPSEIATGSPRRRQQLERRYPDASFVEIRGNVETRLRKVADGEVGSTVLAAAGLLRLGIKSFPGVRFEPIAIEDCVPAAGQAAIAVQCRESEVKRFSPCLHGGTGIAVTLERTFLRAMEGGCQTAFAVHYALGRIHLFHEQCGVVTFTVPGDDAGQVPEEIAMAILRETGLMQ